MYKHLVKDATEEQLRSFVHDALGMIKGTNHDLYEELEMHLYHELYGCHFNMWLLEKATADMANEDGSIGAHWNVEQTTQVAKQYGVEFKHFNEYDWNYVMNMVYSDYYGAVSNDTINYYKLARKFLEDKDARKGKALSYYLAMKD